MLIGKNYKIESDSLNVILFYGSIQKRRATNEPFERWNPIGYYSTVKNALHGLVNREIKATELKDLQTVVAKIDELHQLIDSLPEAV